MTTATVTELHPPAGDPATETWLTELGVTWRYEPALALDRIDHARSLANQARLEAIDGDVVDRYAADMARGDTFPPLLAHQTSRRAKLTLLGGNHRHAAHLKNKHTAAPVYIVECAPEVAMRLMYEDNRRHGLPPSDAERIAQAVHLIDTGWSQAAAAECVGISVNKVQLSLTVVQADRRARSLGVDGWAEIPKTVKARLNSLRSDPVFAKACELTVRCGLGQTVVNDLVTRLKEARSDQAALDLLGAELEARGPSGAVKAKQTPRARMLSGLGHLAGLNPADVAGSCANADQARSLGRQIADTQTRLKATLAELKARWG